MGKEGESTSQERTGFLDLLINTLCEHEKNLSQLIDKLEKITDNLHMTQHNELEALRKVERTDLLIHAILFIDQKGLINEFKDYTHKVIT